MDETRKHRILIGPFGSGKTTACVYKTLELSCAQPPNAQGERHFRGAVIRNSEPDLQSTTIPSWFEIYDEDMGRFRRDHPPVHMIDCELQDGTRLIGDVWFIGLDIPKHLRKLLGLQLTWGWVNECREVIKGVFDILAYRVPRYPPLREGGVIEPAILGDTNAPDADHWLAKMFIEQAEGRQFRQWGLYKQPAGVLLDENGEWIESPEAENLKNLEQNYYMDGIEGRTNDWIKVMLANEWGFVLEGKPVHPNFSQEAHVAKRALKPENGIPLDIGIDFGLTPAATIGQRVPKAHGYQWNILDELVTEDMGAARFVRELKAMLVQRFPGLRARLTGDPSGVKRSETDEKSVFQIFRAAKVPILPASSNIFLTRKETVDLVMERMFGGQPCLQVDPRCHHLIKAWSGGYCFKRVEVAGEERYRDVPQKNMHSHVAESAQYMFLGAGEGHTEIPLHKIQRHMPPKHNTQWWSPFDV